MCLINCVVNDERWRFWTRKWTTAMPRASATRRQIWSTDRVSGRIAGPLDHLSPNSAMDTLKRLPNVMPLRLMDECLSERMDGSAVRREDGQAVEWTGEWLEVVPQPCSIPSFELKANSTHGIKLLILNQYIKKTQHFEQEFRKWLDGLVDIWFEWMDKDKETYGREVTVG